MSNTSIHQVKFLPEEAALVGVTFFRRVSGLVLRPYETYRSILLRNSLAEVLIIWLGVLTYFLAASVVRVNAFRPILLTKQFILLFSGAMCGFASVTLFLHWTGKRLGGQDNFRGIVVGWGYTLVPTLLWFLMTSFLYVLLPPPRTARWEGIVFSVLYLVASTVLMIWKSMLTYLTIRFATKLSAQKIGIMGVFLGGFSVVYALIMYRLGIFRIPFL